METNPLSLIIKEKTLGNLVTNAKDIKAYVEEKLKEYSVDNYAGDAKQAAKDKAEINAAIKTLNDRRIALEKEWNMPFAEFKNIISETCDMMKTASGKLDVIVKAKEEEEKAQKKAQIIELWNGKNFNLVPLDRIFNAKWLNKTTKLAAVDAEIDTIIKKHYRRPCFTGRFRRRHRNSQRLVFVYSQLAADLKQGRRIESKPRTPCTVGSGKEGARRKRKGRK